MVTGIQIRELREQEAACTVSRLSCKSAGRRVASNAITVAYVPCRVLKRLPTVHIHPFIVYGRSAGVPRSVTSAAKPCLASARVSPRFVTAAARVAQGWKETNSLREQRVPARAAAARGVLMVAATKTKVSSATLLSLEWVCEQGLLYQPQHSICTYLYRLNQIDHRNDSIN